MGRRIPSGAVIGCGSVASHATANSAGQPNSGAAVKKVLAGGNVGGMALGTDATTSKSTADERRGGVLNMGDSTATADDSPTVQAGLGSLSIG